MGIGVGLLGSLKGVGDSEAGDTLGCRDGPEAFPL